ATSDALDARHVGAGGLADEKAGAREPAAHRVGFVARDGDPFVDDRLVQDRWHDVSGAEGLEAFDPGKHLGEHRDHADSRIVLLQASAEARHGAARSNAGYDVGEPAAGLLEDLLGSRLVVGAPVILVAVLIAEEIAPGVGLVAAMDLPQGF